ncbi:MAG: hypothetical protein HZC40_23205 [Chloroflexi bacterium]|nr:hypothetical protein [Chloroflexota bacterium]
MSHHIEVDQSGRTDRYNEDTALALSDGIQAAILLSAAVKRECYQKLRARKMSKKLAVVRVFAAGLVILLQDKRDAIDLICIDTEFSGWESDILPHLLRHLKWLRRDQVYFASIGKKSRAHDLAWATFRRKRAPNKKVSVEELLRAC